MSVAQEAQTGWALTPAQRSYLRRALAQPGGKLPLFDEDGQQVDPRIIRACIAKGWAAPWFANPIKPDWLVCRITDSGREAIAEPMSHNAVNQA